MKRMLALLLTAALLLSGCDLLPAAVTDLLPGESGTHKETADPAARLPRSIRIPALPSMTMLQIWRRWA